MTVSYNSLWHRDGRICHILRREYVQAEEDMNEKCIMQGEAWYLKWKRVGKWCWFVKKKLFREKECMCWGRRGQRQEKRVFKQKCLERAGSDWCSGCAYDGRMCVRHTAWNW